jgi:hypothetical protein
MNSGASNASQADVEEPQDFTISEKFGMISRSIVPETKQVNTNEHIFKRIKSLESDSRRVFVPKSNTGSSTNVDDSQIIQSNDIDLDVPAHPISASCGETGQNPSIQSH